MFFSEKRGSRRTLYILPTTPTYRISKNEWLLHKKYRYFRNDKKSEKSRLKMRTVAFSFAFFSKIGKKIMKTNKNRKIMEKAIYP